MDVVVNGRGAHRCLRHWCLGTGALGTSVHFVWKCSLFSLTPNGLIAHGSAGAGLGPGHDYALVVANWIIRPPIEIFRRFCLHSPNRRLVAKPVPIPASAGTGFFLEMLSFICRIFRTENRFPLFLEMLSVFAHAKWAHRPWLRGGGPRPGA